MSFPLLEMTLFSQWLAVRQRKHRFRKTISTHLLKHSFPNWYCMFLPLFTMFYYFKALFSSLTKRALNNLQISQIQQMFANRTRQRATLCCTPVLQWFIVLINVIILFLVFSSVSGWIHAFETNLCFMEDFFSLFIQCRCVWNLLVFQRVETAVLLRFK